MAILRSSIKWQFYRNIAQLNILCTKQTLIIYLGYLGILSFGKLGLLSLSPSFILLLELLYTRYTHTDERDRFLPCSSNLRWHSEHLESPKSSNSSSSTMICPSAATEQPTIFFFLSFLYFFLSVFFLASVCRKEKQIFTEPGNKL